MPLAISINKAKFTKTTFSHRDCCSFQTFDLRCLELRRLALTAGAQLLEHGGDPHPVHGHARAATHPGPTPPERPCINHLRLCRPLAAQGLWQGLG